MVVSPRSLAQHVHFEVRVSLYFTQCSLELDVNTTASGNPAIREVLSGILPNSTRGAFAVDESKSVQGADINKAGVPRIHDVVIPEARRAAPISSETK